MCILTLKVVFLFNYWNALDVEVLTCYWLTIVLGLLNKKTEGEKKKGGVKTGRGKCCIIYRLDCVHG